MDAFADFRNTTQQLVQHRTMKVYSFHQSVASQSVGPKWWDGLQCEVQMRGNSGSFQWN